MTQWIWVPVNPEPWAIGPLQMGKRGGKFFPRIGANQQLVAYKEAVREALHDREPLGEGEYELFFYFWRRLDDYETRSGRRHRKHVADATNLQKATEDALQDVLIGNDRFVRRVGSLIVEQGPNVKAGIVIRAELWLGWDTATIPDSVWKKREQDSESYNFNGNQWPPPEGVF